MEHHGIDPHMMQTVPFPTGTCTVILDEEKIPSFWVASNVAYDHIHFTEGLIKQIQDENDDCRRTFGGRNSIARLRKPRNRDTNRRQEREKMYRSKR